MVDIILAVLAICGVIAYFLPLVLSVYGPALVAVLGIVVLMAVYDFTLEIRRIRDK